MREAVRQIDLRAAVDNIAPMSAIVSNSIAEARLYAVLVGIFAAVAVAIAAVGIYGVLACAVSRRTREIGIRMALGAERRNVIALVVRQGAALTAIGTVAGVLLAAAATRYLEGMLFGLTPLDPSTFIVVVVTFAAVATLAAYVPARRATRVDPVVALRGE